ncbi:hypothetical protein V8F33_005514 [Rhypophila sp. PSN 637]
MEVVGFVAAVGSIGNVAYKFGTKISRVAKEAGTVGQRIERTSLLFITFGTAIKMAEISLDHRCLNLVDSKVTLYMRENNLLRNMKRFSRIIQQDIQIQEREISAVTSLFSFITSWKWDKLEQRIFSLLPQMECLKTNMNMILDILTLEAIYQMNEARPSQKYEKEIEFLKTQIVEHIDTIRHLKRSNRELLKLMTPQPIESSESGSRSPEVDQLRVLCHLGQSLVERGAIPTQPPEEFSFKDARRLRRYRQRQATSVKRHPNPTPLNTNTSDHERPAGPGASPVPSPNNRVRPVSTSSPDNPAERRDRRRHVEQRDTPAEPTPPQTPTSPAQPLPNTLSPSLSQSRGSHTLKSSQFDQANPAGNIGNFSIETGYLINKTPTGKRARVTFEAHIDQQLKSENYITLQYATELEMEIKRHPRRTLVYRGAEIESIGKVMLKWDTLPGDNRVLEPSNIEVIVCEKLPRYRLIFGQWFADAK